MNKNCLKGWFHEIFYLQFFSSNCSTWDPDSWVEWILLKSFFPCSYLSFFSGTGFPPLWDTAEENFFRCGIQEKRFSSGVGYTTEQFQDVQWRIFFCCIQQSWSFFHYIPQQNSFSSVQSHSTKESSAVYPTTQNVLFRCGIQHSKMIPRKIILLSFNFKCVSSTWHEILDKSRYLSMQINPWREWKW